MNITDEALHLTSTQHMINLMKSGQDDPEMKEIAHELEQETIEIFKMQKHCILKY